MDIKRTILEILKRKKSVTTADIVNVTGFSRVYINRFFKQLREEGRVALIGKANKARYVLANSNQLQRAKKEANRITRTLTNIDLAEDVVLSAIKKESGIFLNMPNSISDILAYAFLEMLNNAIEHSNSKTVNVEFCRGPKSAFFKIIDKGVGIFNNIKSKKKLKNEKEAIEDLLKGKQTTEPQAHRGEGIFFTSKVATAFTIQSNTKKIVFDNLIKDVFIKDSKPTKGTKIYFSILLDSKNNLREVFNKYSDDSFKFNKTEVKARLYKSDTEYISRFRQI